MTTATTTTLANGSLQVVFYWLEDRLAHTLSQGEGSDSQVVWQSSHTSPRGPAFQELHEQTLDSGDKVLFLSGAGDGANWSMSVHPEGEVITFDVAARIASEPVGRRIEYISNDNAKRDILLEAIDTGTLITREAENITTIQQSATGQTLPTTLRWKYVARLIGTL